MTTRSKFRGYDIEYIEELDQWIFSDTKEPTSDTYEQRPCGHCNEFATPEGHDACLGTLVGVRNACCGHGVKDEAYVQLLDGFCVRGNDATIVMDILSNTQKNINKSVTELAKELSEELNKTIKAFSRKYDVDHTQSTDSEKGLIKISIKKRS